ncbi:MAG: hypothetical protein EA378_11425 [Phycisphaerales bacterium]|nr:MAG: hypothetical protein EA378_11425 [Phycisphaerales bacterium]
MTAPRDNTPDRTSPTPRAAAIAAPIGASAAVASHAAARDDWDDWVRSPEPGQVPRPAPLRPDETVRPPSSEQPRDTEATEPSSAPDTTPEVDPDAGRDTGDTLAGDLEAAGESLLSDPAWGEFAAGVGERLSSWASGGPFELHALLGVAILAGVGLWLFGARLAKPMFLVFGFVLGATLGFVLLPVFGPDVIEGVPSPYIGFAGGSVLGMIASAIVFRFTIALAAAGVFAVAGVLASSLYIDRYGLPDTPTRAVAAAVESAEGQRNADGRVRTGRASIDRGVLEMPLRIDLGLGRRAARDAEDQPNEQPNDHRTARPASRERHAEGAWADPETGETRETLAARTRSALDSGRSEAGTFWHSIPPKERFVLLGAGIAGGVLGLLVGLAMPKRSAMLVTALAGSAVWLLGLALAAGTAQLTIPSMLGEDPAARLILWVAVALVGVGGQVIVTKRAKPTPAV